MTGHTPCLREQAAKLLQNRLHERLAELPCHGGLPKVIRALDRIEIVLIQHEPLTAVLIERRTRLLRCRDLDGLSSLRWLLRGERQQQNIVLTIPADEQHGYGDWPVLAPLCLTLCILPMPQIGINAEPYRARTRRSRSALVRRQKRINGLCDILSQIGGHLGRCS